MPNLIIDNTPAAGADLQNLAAINGGQLAGLRNRIINGNFGINQRAVSGTVVLAAGVYGHDRFKGGASGCTYTFATSNNVTTITISAGSLQQVIEGLNLESGTYTLSWTGTAQGKIGAGSYGASGITGSITGGTNTTIEFNTGTVSKVQLEFGSTVSLFEQRPVGMELALCQRYFNRYAFASAGWCISASGVRYAFTFPAMRTTPSFGDLGSTVAYGPGGSQPLSSITPNTSASTYIEITATAAGSGLTTNAGALVYGTCNLTAEI